MKLGTTIFWIGFSLTIGVIVAYIIMMIVDITFFVTWLMSLSMCGTVLLGAMMMLIGRVVERRASAGEPYSTEQV